MPKLPLPLPDEQPVAVNALRNKRTAIAGEIEMHSREIDRLRRELIHLDATLRLFDPATDPQGIPALLRHRGAPNGSLAARSRSGSMKRSATGEGSRPARLPMRRSRPSKSPRRTARRRRISWPASRMSCTTPARAGREDRARAGRAVEGRAEGSGAYLRARRTYQAVWSLAGIYASTFRPSAHNS
jgi:hypothetical protein